MVLLDYGLRREMDLAMSVKSWGFSLILSNVWSKGVACKKRNTINKFE